MASDITESEDAVGNMAAEQATITTAQGYGGLTQYAHDAKNQLTQEQSSAVGGYTNGFGYDAAGNPTTWKGAGQGFNPDNQSTASTYDGNGNPTSYKGQGLTFDAENRLTQYGTAMLAGYTGEGLRAWKQTGAGRTYFLYDGTKPVLELNASGTVTAVNTWGHYGLLSRHSNGSSVFYAFGTHGDAAQRLDGAGNVLSTQRFDGFGSRVSTDNNADPYAGFCGQQGYYTDWETGLQLLTHRYYDPSLGRFLTRDPSGYSGGVNLYEYCGNSPTVQMDPSGLNPFLNAFMGCSALITYLFDAMFFGHKTQGELTCDELAQCIGSIVGAVVGWAVTVATADPMLGGCAEGIAGALEHTIVNAVCRYMTCQPQDNVICIIFGFFIDAMAGCVVGATLGSVGEAPIKKELFESLGVLFSDVFGISMDDLCDRSMEAGDK